MVRARVLLRNKVRPYEDAQRVASEQLRRVAAAKHRLEANDKRACCEMHTGHFRNSTFMEIITIAITIFRDYQLLAKNYARPIR